MRKVNHKRIYSISINENVGNKWCRYNFQQFFLLIGEFLFAIQQQKIVVVVRHQLMNTSFFYILFRLRQKVNFSQLDRNNKCFSFFFISIFNINNTICYITRLLIIYIYFKIRSCSGHCSNEDICFLLLINIKIFTFICNICMEEHVFVCYRTS